MSAKASCPKCGGSFGAQDARDASISCADCGGVWVPEGTLRDGIRAYLIQQGYDDQIVALHEMPAGRTSLACPVCPDVQLTAIKLRAVEVERCDRCKGMYLDRGDVPLIAERVRISARTPKGRQPLTGNPKLASILANPRAHGSGGG